MRFRHILVFMLVLAAPLQSAEERKESEEPPLQFSLESNGKAMPVQLDTPFQLPAENAAQPQVLRLKPYREFKVRGITFKYPKEYGFEYTGEASHSQWTLSGNDCKIIMTKSRVPGDAGIFLNATVQTVLQAFKGSTEGATDTTVRLGQHELKGKRVDAQLVGTSIRQEFYAFDVDGNPMILILQDVPKEGVSTDEYKQTLKAIAGSFEITSEKKK